MSGRLIPAWSLTAEAQGSIAIPSAWPEQVTREWAIGAATGEGVDVCILDSGVDGDHPLVGGLASAVAVSLEGEETTIGPDELGDVCGHGTACAGIVRSLAPACRLHSVRVLGEGNTGSADLILGGLRYAIEQGFEVVNLSLSTTKRRFAELLHELADSAYFKGTVLVASAHNMPVESYPWRFSSVISVALIAFAVVGIGNSVADIAALTLFQRLVPDHVLGRVLGVLEGILLAAIGLGGLAAPLCISLFGAKPSLLAAGILLPAATILVAGSLAAIDRTTTAPAHTALLRDVPLLGVLPEPVLEFLAASAMPFAARAGETIIREGETGDRFYVIESGEVEILGRTFGPGEAFGEIALLRDVPRTATVTAVTDVSLVTLERDVFVSAVTGHGPAHASAEELVAERLGSFSPLLG